MRVWLIRRISDLEQPYGNGSVKSGTVPDICKILSGFPQILYQFLMCTQNLKRSLYIILAAFGFAFVVMKKEKLSFAILFSYFLLKEKIRPYQLICTVIAFAGAMFILRPGFDSVATFPAVIGLIGGMGAGLVYTNVRLASKHGAPGPLIVFCFSVFSCISAIPFIIFDHKPLAWWQLASLLMAGLSATLGQFSITAAYTYAPATKININGPFLLRKIGRNSNFPMLQYVKKYCKGGNDMNGTEKESRRRVYLDNIRWITVVLVVIYHVIYMFNGVQPFGVIGPFHERQLQDGFLYLVYPWFMALLFVVSGMSARYYLQGHDMKQFLRDKTRKLLVPSTIGLLVFQWILGICNMKIGGAMENLAGVPKPVLYLIAAVSGVGVLWYIQVLWTFSVLLLAIRKIEKDRLWNLGEKTSVWFVLLLVIGVYGSAQILNTPVVTVYRYGIYGFCFFTGYYIFSHDEVMERLGKWWIAFDLVAVVLGISYTVIYFGENYATEPVINNVLACVYCWFAILAILTTMQKYGERSNAFTRWMSRKAWGLYVFHYLPIAVVSYDLKQYVPDLPVCLVYLIVGISAFAGAFLLNEVISRIPVIRWCVLGIKKEKKNV